MLNSQFIIEYMDWINKIKLYFFRQQLKKEQVLFERIRKSPSESKTVGILFDASSTENINAINQLAEDLRNAGKKVRMLAFFNDKLPHEGLPYPHFNLKEVNWFHIPKKEVAAVYDFMKQPFDIMYSIYLRELLVLDYISSLSKGQFKTGVVSEFHREMDLGVDMNGNTDVKLLLNQINFYLNKINQKHESLVKI